MAEKIVTVVTATYNKPRHILEAAESLLNQTFPHWNWWLILDGPTQESLKSSKIIQKKISNVAVTHLRTTEEERQSVYRPALIVNQFYPKITTKYVLWLSDDDLLFPTSLERLVNCAEKNGSDVVFGMLDRVFETNAGQLYFQRTTPLDGRFGPGGDDPIGKLDGGQILHTMKSYRKINYEIPTEYGPTTGSADGLFLRKLAEKYYFTMLEDNRSVAIHRHTSLSRWNRGRCTLKLPYIRYILPDEFI